MISIILSVLAGISLNLQNSLNGILTGYVGAMETSFAGFVVQSVFLVLLYLCKEHRMAPLGKVPLPYYASGLLAALIVGITGFCVSQLGSAVTTCCSVAGQIIMSALVDHFGLFGSKKSPFSVKRLPGFILILIGVLFINLFGGTKNGKASLGFLLIAMCLGFCSILVRVINYKIRKKIGSAIGGGIVNSLSGMVFSCIFFMFSVAFKPDFTAFAQGPAVCYFAGVFGSLCMLCTITAYDKQNVFYSTVFMLVGQIGTGILMDIFVFHLLSAGKCIGIVIVLVGILLDKWITVSKRGTNAEK